MRWFISIYKVSRYKGKISFKCSGRKLNILTKKALYFVILNGKLVVYGLELITLKQKIITFSPNLIYLELIEVRFVFWLIISSDLNLFHELNFKTIAYLDTS